MHSRRSRVSPVVFPKARKVNALRVNILEHLATCTPRVWCTTQPVKARLISKSISKGTTLGPYPLASLSARGTACVASNAAFWLSVHRAYIPLFVTCIVSALHFSRATTENIRFEGTGKCTKKSTGASRVNIPCSSSRSIGRGRE